MLVLLLRVGEVGLGVGNQSIWGERSSASFCICRELERLQAHGDLRRRPCGSLLCGLALNQEEA